MKITELARVLGVSTPTIYRRLKAENLSLDELRDGGELTQHGQQVIAALFDGTSQSEKRNASDTLHEPLRDTLQHDTPLQVENASLRAQVDGLRAQVELLQGQVNDYRRQLEQVTAALQAEQSDRQSERALLTAAPSQRHWWQWWRK